MKNICKIITLCFCLLLFLNACQLEDEGNTAEIDSKTNIAITVNPDNGGLKKAYVDKDKLVDYINQTDSHEFYYEDFKEKVGLEIENTYEIGYKADSYQDFKDDSDLIVAVKKDKEDKDYSLPHRILINGKGEELINDKNIVFFKIINNEFILTERTKDEDDPLRNEYCLYDKTGKKMINFGKYDDCSLDYTDQNIISFVKDYDDDSHSYFFYNFKERNFVDAPKNFHYGSFEYYDSYYALKDSDFDIVDYKHNSDSYVIKSKTNNKKSIELKEPKIEGDYLIGYPTDDSYLKIYDKNLDEAFTEKFHDFYHLGDNYYAGSKYYEDNSSDDSFNMDTEHYKRMASEEYTRDYRQDAIFDDKKLSNFKYFMIDYLGNDIFYVFDGEHFDFINMKTKEQAYKHVDEKFDINNFKVYDNIIIGTNYDNAQILITDKNYMITSSHTKNKKVEILREIKNNNFCFNTYPRFILEDKQIEDKLNGNISSEFNFANYQETEPVYTEDKTAVSSFSNTNCYTKLKNDYALVNAYHYGQGFGAHPYYSCKHLIFDLTTGDLVKFDDLFNNPSEALDVVLKNMVEETYSNEDLKYSNAFSMLEEGKNPNEVFLNEYIPEFNFTFTDEGIEILYNPYELGCYAMGPISYTIPYEVIKPYFKDEVIKKLGI